MNALSPFLGDSAIDLELQQLCRLYQILPLHADEQTLTVAASVQLKPEHQSALRFASGRRVIAELWPAARLEQALHQENTSPSTLAPGVVVPPGAEAETNGSADDTPVVQFINQLLLQAIQRRASDIHFEPYQHSYRVRLRIDGVLQQVMAPPDGMIQRLTARLKIMGQLNIAERRLPQDGQLTFNHRQRRYTLRIATLPTQFGEKVVLRILPTGQQTFSLEESGMNAGAQTLFRRVLEGPQGLILVTGPTGSGKTVTLYSAIHLLNDSTRNICSVEDPIEIPLTGINQTPVNPKADLSFARVLRALLRQDPDVIMIGEIRDGETAEIAVNAAQTGHLVLSTLHTNSTTETLLRLAQMGVAHYLLASSLKLIVAQRLVRRLCPHCRQQQQSVTHFPAALWSGELRRWQAAGCPECLSGYYGRTGLYELLSVTPEIQLALGDSVTTPQQLAQIAQEQGQISLLQSGLKLVDEGITSLEEVYRVIGSRDE